MLDILVRVLPMNSKKELLRSDLDSVVIDVTEQPIERPKQQQCHYYSGKKMPYSQSPTDYLLGEFADSIGHLSKGQSPRFSDTQREPSTYQPETEKLADGGYQGIDKVYPNSVSPVKRSRNKVYLMPSVGSMKRWLGAE